MLEDPVTGDTLLCNVTGAKSLLCENGFVYEEIETDVGWRVYLDIGMCILLVLFAGMMSGLTMGLMSLDMTNLKIIAKSGDPQQQRYAKKIMPLVAKHHLLLVTLLTGNALCMEALPLFLDRLVGPVFAIVLSVTLVLLFGEYVEHFSAPLYPFADPGGLGSSLKLSAHALVLLLVLSSRL